MDAIIHSNIINVLIAAIFLIWVFKRFKLLSILDKRQAQVIKDLKDAEAKREKALQELDVLEKRSLKLREEVEIILDEAQKSAEMVGQSILHNAEEEARKLMDNAQKRIALESRTAARELETRLMQEAIYAAQQLLENTLDEADKHRSIEDFVQSLPELVKKES
jgi:F-type H+-transporting ATPase subunit b